MAGNIANVLFVDGLAKLTCDTEQVDDVVRKACTQHRGLKPLKKQ